MNRLLAAAIAIPSFLAVGCSSTPGHAPVSSGAASPAAANEQMCQVFRAGLTPDPLGECMRELGPEDCKRCLAW